MRINVHGETGLQQVIRTRIYNEGSDLNLKEQNEARYAYTVALLKWLSDLGREIGLSRTQVGEAKSKK